MDNNSQGLDTRASIINNTTTPVTNQIETIMTELRTVIDNLDKNFIGAKRLILELARQLDETRQIKQNKICRKIKDILKDKITEKKISSKWIEKCLPNEVQAKIYQKRTKFAFTGSETRRNCSQ